MTVHSFVPSQAITKHPPPLHIHPGPHLLLQTVLWSIDLDNLCSALTFVICFEELMSHRVHAEVSAELIFLYGMAQDSVSCVGECLSGL